MYVLTVTVVYNNWSYDFSLAQHHRETPAAPCRNIVLANTIHHHKHREALQPHLQITTTAERFDREQYTRNKIDLCIQCMSKQFIR